MNGPVPSAEGLIAVIPPAPPKPPRTWRPMVGWTLGILAALGLAWFVAAVVVPCFCIRAGKAP